MSLASLIIVAATLVIFGFFLLIAFNLELNINVLKEQPQLEAFCFSVLDDTQVQMVEDSIKNNDKIARYEKVTKKQALKKMEENLGKDAAVLEGFDENIFPVSFIIKLKDNGNSEEVVRDLETTSGVEKVSYSQDAIELISKVSYWVKFICSLMTIILLVVSVFIIANTIKLTVFARRKEINIMKYIGATDWFIRWPFVVEGVIIGLLGAVLAFVSSTYGYSMLEGKFTHELISMGTDLLKIIKIRDVWFQLIVSYMAIGVIVGAAGSFFSIRKYLRV
jgi:cell division transport system permease protein